MILIAYERKIATHFDQKIPNIAFPIRAPNTPAKIQQNQKYIRPLPQVLPALANPAVMANQN